MSLFDKTGVISFGEGWRIVNELRLQRGLPKFYRHYDTRINVKLEMQNANAYEEMADYVFLCGKEIANGCGTGNDQKMGRLCAEQLRKPLKETLLLWKNAGVRKIVAVSSAWVFDYYADLLLKEICNRLMLDWECNVVKYAVCALNEEQSETLQAFQKCGANVYVYPYDDKENEKADLLETIHLGDLRVCKIIFDKG